MNDAGLIAMVAGAIRYGHIGTAKEIVAEAAQIVALAEEAAAAPAPKTNDSESLLQLAGAGHQVETPNTAAVATTTEDPAAERDVLIRLEQQNEQLAARIRQLQADAAPPAAGA